MERLEGRKYRVFQWQVKLGPQKISMVDIRIVMLLHSLDTFLLKAKGCLGGSGRTENEKWCFGMGGCTAPPSTGLGLPSLHIGE